MATDTLNPNWWDEANDTVLDFIAEKAGLFKERFGTRRIVPGYVDREPDGDYTVTVAHGSAFYVLTYRLEGGRFAEAFVLTCRPFHDPEYEIQI